MNIEVLLCSIVLPTEIIDIICKLKINCEKRINHISICIKEINNRISDQYKSINLSYMHKIQIWHLIKQRNKLNKKLLSMTIFR